jgi:hypothetical protein
MKLFGITVTLIPHSTPACGCGASGGVGYDSIWRPHPEGEANEFDFD